MPPLGAGGDDGHAFGAHGLFDETAHEHSPQVWASQHHGTLAVAGAGLVAGVAAVVRWAGGRSAS